MIYLTDNVVTSAVFSRFGPFCQMASINSIVRLTYNWHFILFRNRIKFTNGVNANVVMGSSIAKAGIASSHHDTNFVH